MTFHLRSNEGEPDAPHLTRPDIGPSIQTQQKPRRVAAIDHQPQKSLKDTGRLPQPPKHIPKTRPSAKGALDAAGTQTTMKRGMVRAYRGPEKRIRTAVQPDEPIDFQTTCLDQDRGIRAPDLDAEHPGMASQSFNSNVCQNRDDTSNQSTDDDDGDQTLNGDVLITDEKPFTWSKDFVRGVGRRVHQVLTRWKEEKHFEPDRISRQLGIGPGQGSILRAIPEINPTSRQDSPVWPKTSPSIDEIGFTIEYVVKSIGLSEVTETQSRVHMRLGWMQLAVWASLKIEQLMQDTSLKPRQASGRVRHMIFEATTRGNSLNEKECEREKKRWAEYLRSGRRWIELVNNHGVGILLLLPREMYIAKE